MISKVAITVNVELDRLLLILSLKYNKSSSNWRENAMYEATLLLLAFYLHHRNSNRDLMRRPETMHRHMPLIRKISSCADPS
jgi:hypothetical protein